MNGSTLPPPPNNFKRRKRTSLPSLAEISYIVETLLYAFITVMNVSDRDVTW